ncbi:AAA family ATPase [Candidatus Collierbacteria bacterium]|nr:AAA family ATPase [Candidatus Collierbacteria bacterium]
MPSLLEEIEILKNRVASSRLPKSIQEKADGQIERLTRLSGRDYTLEADTTIRWIDWITSIPWENRAPSSLDLIRARQILDKNHYGLDDVKQRILEYLAVMKLRLTPNAQTNNQQLTTIPNHARAPILLLVGLVGTGKTTLAYSIAQSLNRPIVRIPFGGMGSARDLRGQSRLHPESEPGQIIKGLKQAGVKNPIMLLDELDRVSDEARHDIMGVLVELLDPEQNKAFLDHYLDVPVDLSEVVFIATANNTNNIATAVMDRLEPLSMPSYTDDQKIVIAKDYLLPKAREEAGIPAEALVFDDDAWHLIVRPLGYDAGIRTLQRTIQHLSRQAAMNIVSGQPQVLHITKDNFKHYIGEW